MSKIVTFNVTGLGDDDFLFAISLADLDKFLWLLQFVEWCNCCGRVTCGFYQSLSQGAGKKMALDCFSHLDCFLT